MSEDGGEKQKKKKADKEEVINFRNKFRVQFGSPFLRKGFGFMCSRYTLSNTWAKPMLRAKSKTGVSSSAKNNLWHQTSHTFVFSLKY